MVQASAVGDIPRVVWQLHPKALSQAPNRRTPCAAVQAQMVEDYAGS